jgi:hypothetical protein
MLKVNHELQAILQRDISVVTLFQNPTIYSLAQYLSQSTEDELAFETVRDSPSEKLRQRIQKQKAALNKYNKVRANQIGKN